MMFTNIQSSVWLPLSKCNEYSLVGSDGATHIKRTVNQDTLLFMPTP